MMSKKVLILDDMDFSIGYFSTSLIEGLIYRILVISLYISRYYNLLLLWCYRLSERVSSFEDLDGKVNEFLHEKWNKSRFLDSVEEAPPI